MLRNTCKATMVLRYFCDAIQIKYVSTGTTLCFCVKSLGICFEAIRNVSTGVVLCNSCNLTRNVASGITLRNWCNAPRTYRPVLRYVIGVMPPEIGLLMSVKSCYATRNRKY